MLEALTPASRSDVEHTEKELTEQQGEAVVLLAQGEAIVHIAETIGVSARTIHRWQHIPEFKAAVKQARQEAYQEALGLVQSHMTKAVMTLVGLLNAKADYIKLGASSELIKLGIESHSLDEIEVKLAELEARLVDNKKAPALWAI